MREDGETLPRLEQAVPETEIITESALPDEVIICAAQSEIMEVAVHVDLRDGYMMQVMALIDTGSNISFMGQEVLEKLAPTPTPPPETGPLRKESARDIWRCSPCQGIPIPDVQHRWQDDGA